jgi:hypothetical protein
MDVAEEHLPLERWLSGLRLATAETVGHGAAANETVGPLRLVRILSDAAGPDAELLDEALATGRTALTEVSAAGVVALLRVSHGGSRPLLIVDGEHVVGGKQDRIFNASFLVGSGQTLDLPVSCVERGRWRPVDAGFRSAKTTVASGVRAAKVRRLHASLLGRGAHDCDQRETWNDVDGYFARTGARSATAAYGDAFRTRGPAFEAIVESMRPMKGQVGIAAVAAEGLVGLDLFGSESLFSRAWTKIGLGLMSEVHPELLPPDLEASLRAVTAALRAMASSKVHRVGAPGIGDTLHGTNQGVTYGGVALAGVLYHAVAVQGGEAPRP